MQELKTYSWAQRRLHCGAFGIRDDDGMGHCGFSPRNGQRLSEVGVFWRGGDVCLRERRRNHTYGVSSDVEGYYSLSRILIGQYTFVVTSLEKKH